MLNSDQAIRVLQINAGSKNFGGVSAFILNIYRNVDREKVQFDFLTPNITTYESHRQEIECMGGKIHQFGIETDSQFGKLRFMSTLAVFLRKHQYEIIHINSGALLFNLCTAFTCRHFSKSRIFVHSHNSRKRKPWKDKMAVFLKKIIVGQADLLLSCSKPAAAYMYPDRYLDRVLYIKNGICSEKFDYSFKKRTEIRTKLKIKDETFVIGNVGRFVTQKNHFFMLDVFEAVMKKNPDAMLLLIGQGELENDIRKKVFEKGLQKKVLFAGEQKSVSDYYQAMDVFFLPSLYEGFGIVNIEAQTAGLWCVTSDTVPEEADVVGRMTRISLDLPVSEWAEQLLTTRIENRRGYAEQIKKAGFDIRNSAYELSKIYFSYGRVDFKKK